MGGETISENTQSIKSRTYNLKYIAAVAVEDDLEIVPQAVAVLKQSILDKNRW